MKKIIRTLTFFFLFNLILGCCPTISDIEQPHSMLWYLQPATEWEKALPLGNGRLGVMLFGDPKNERIQLNDDSLWPADLGWDHPSGTSEDLEEIRALIKNGNAEAADALLVEKFSRKTIVRSHQTLGNLHIRLQHDCISDYKRSLDLSSAIATTAYKVDGYAVSQTVFVSQPHQAILVHLESEHPKGLNGTLHLSRPQDEGFETANTQTSNNNQLIMEGEVTQRKGQFDSKPIPITKGVKFQTILDPVFKGGRIEMTKDHLTLEGVRELTLRIVSNSSFYQDDYHEKNLNELKLLNDLSIKKIQTTHIADHQSLYHRVQLSLEEDSNQSNLPTDKRIAIVKNGGVDIGLQALLFHYGRYLLIASSRIGTQPANLQGLWNQHINAPWNADYHLNINLQMNYWPANVTQLDELNGPLFDYVDRLIESGKTTAQKNFGARGAFLPHATDLWAPTWLRAPTAYWGASFGAGGWMVQHYWNHFEFTQDFDFLKTRGFPAIESVAQFYSDWLTVDERDSTLIATPSTSPENRYLNAEGKPVASCQGSAMDQQVVREVFENYLMAAALLSIENPLTETIKNQLHQLRPGFVLGSDGRILEWDREYAELEPGHRHMSHLYGFHPGNQISPIYTPLLFDAVRKTLDFRLENGGAGTGWSRAWLINFSARLLDGEMAQQHIQLLFEKSIFDNLFDAHPPFQIDGNFGYTAGIAETLIQSYETDIIRLLPALPHLWKSGQIKGLKARGNITVDMQWENSTLLSATLIAKNDVNTKLFYGDKSYEIQLKKGIPYEFKNPN